MSDIKIVGANARGRDCDHEKHDGDCGCHVDHVTIGGRGTKHHPFKAIGLPNAAPFASKTTTIYVRPDGKNKKGRGKTADDAYATLQYALTQVTNILDAGASVIFDITGVTETLPPDFEFPTILTSVTFGQGVVIQATPQLTTLLSPAAATITGADGGNVSSGPGAPVPISNLVTLTVATAGKWGAVNLKGKQLIRSSQGIGGSAACTIYGNDATHLYLCQDAAALNGGNGALDLTGGDTLQIVEPSATLIGSPPVNNFAAISCWNINQIAFIGIHFVSPGLSPALALGNSSTPEIAGCVVEGLLAVNTPNGLFIDATNLQLSYDLEPVPGLPTRTLFSNFNLPPPYAGNGSYFYIAAILQTFTDVVFDNTCPTLTSANFNNAQLPSNWGLQNVLFQGSTGDAIQATNGQWGLVNVEIDNAAGNGITASIGPTTVQLGNVGSVVPNAGVGISIQDGIQVKADVATTMTNPGAGNPLSGPPGQEISIGSLGVQTWATLAGFTNIVDNATGVASLATLSRISQS